MLAAFACLIVTKIAIVPLFKGVQQATAIVVGRVVEVTRIKGHRFAEVSVERTLKGSVPRRFRYLAEPTGEDDVSDARQGERALFLLDPDRMPNDAKIRLALKQSRRTDIPHFTLDFAGYGRIVLTPWRGLYSIGYALPTLLKPGGSSRGRLFTEAKFVAAVEAMIRGETFEPRKRRV